MEELQPPRGGEAQLLNADLTEEREDAELVKRKKRKKKRNNNIRTTASGEILPAPTHRIRRLSPVSHYEVAERSLREFLFFYSVR